jgi:parvulin-like peptidyl-prolyl isomerase
MSNARTVEILRARLMAGALLLVFAGSAVNAQAPAATPPAAVPSPVDATVLLRSGTVVVTRADYDAELLRIPESHREAFGVDASRVDAMLGNLLVQKVLAAQARETGIDRDPMTQRRIANEIDKLLSAERLLAVEAEARREFDAQNTDARVREVYLQRKESLRTPEQVSVTHILFETKKRSTDEAMKLAQDVRARIVAGEDMEALARALSDDPSARRNGGRLDYFVKERMDPAFSRASFAMVRIGEVSEPVVSRFGVHVIRLEGRKESAIPPFEDVKGTLTDEMRKAHVDRRRAEFVGGIRTDPNVYVNRDAVQALVVRPDPETIRKPIREATSPK